MRDAADASGRSDGVAPDLARLSPREREIVRMWLSGVAPTEVARSLHISIHTVRNHLRAVYRKLGVHSQLDLLRRFVRLPANF